MKRAFFVSVLVLSMLICGTSFAAKKKKDCPDKWIGAPKTEVLTYRGEGEAGYPMFLFPNGKEHALRYEASTVEKILKIIAKLKKGNKVSASYQTLETWDEEGEASCQRYETLRTIEVLKK